MRTFSSWLVFKRNLCTGNSSLSLLADTGRFVQRLVRTRGWSYARLPLDGLRSVVFDHPSPTHCVASGNVWLDHPCEQQARCVSHEAVLQLHAAPEQSKGFDWEHFYFLDQVCLRLSKAGHDEQAKTCPTARAD